MQKLAEILLKTEPINVRVLEVVHSQQPSEFCRLGKSDEQVSLHAEEFSVDSKSDLERAIVEKLNSRSAYNEAQEKSVRKEHPIQDWTLEE